MRVLLCFQLTRNVRFNWSMYNFKFNYLSRDQLVSLNLDKIFLPLLKILPCYEVWLNFCHYCSNVLREIILICTVCSWWQLKLGASILVWLTRTVQYIPLVMVTSAFVWMGCLEMERIAKQVRIIWFFICMSLYWITVHNFAISRSAAVSTVLIYCDIKWLTWYGCEIMVTWPNFGKV